MPKELEVGLTRAVRELADRRTVFPMATFMFAVFGVLAYRSHSVWVYFVPPTLGSLLASLILILQPFNPYINFFATLEGRHEEDIENEPNAQRLLFLLQSQKAQFISLCTGLVLAFSLCILMLLVALTQTRPFVSGLKPIDLVFNTFGFWAASFYVHLHFLLSWALREWRLAT